MTSKEALTALFTEANRLSCEEPKYTTHDLWEMASQIQNDLDNIEVIEEELGIDLITLFKTLKYGVYYFTNGVQLTKDYVGLIDNYMGVGPHEKLSYSFITRTERQILSFNDYGKTWALTKEELENEK